MIVAAEDGSSEVPQVLKPFPGAAELGREGERGAASEPVLWAETWEASSEVSCIVSFDKGLGLRWGGLYEVRDGGDGGEGWIRISSGRGVV